MEDRTFQILNLLITPYKPLRKYFYNSTRNETLYLYFKDTHHNLYFEYNYNEKINISFKFPWVSSTNILFLGFGNFYQFLILSFVSKVHTRKTHKRKKKKNKVCSVRKRWTRWIYYRRSSPSVMNWCPLFLQWVNLLGEGYKWRLRYII